MAAAARDEMVDTSRRLRSAWKPVMETANVLGAEELARRAASLNHQLCLAAPLGAGRGRDCDPLPLPLTDEEFAAIERGLVQRATMLAALADDLYGPQTALHDGLLPPALVFASPHFVRGMRLGHPLPGRRLTFYAADLVRGPDGGFSVLHDHTGLVHGLGHAFTLRRLAAGTVPEFFRAGSIRSLRPSRELLMDHLWRLNGDDGLAAVLSAKSASAATAPDMMDDALLARALGLQLVEPGDLTIRGGAVRMKSLNGLLRVDTLLCGLPAAELDPLEQGGPPAAGIAGVFGAIRAGAVTMLNCPGTALVQAPQFMAHQAALFERFSDRAALLPVFEGELLTQISKAPFATGGALTSLPVMFRLFAFHDGRAWHVLPGGVAYGLDNDAAPAVVKDIWVMEAEEPQPFAGTAGPADPPERGAPASILPSRVADNLFWLGRSVERLEAAARLLMLALPRLESGTSLPRDVAERGLIGDSLAQAGLLPEDLAGNAVSGRFLRTVLARRRPVAGLVKDVSRLIDASSERLSPSMLSTVRFALQPALDAVRLNEEEALPQILAFAAVFAGIAAENMSRDGGWLFLEMGRRLERGETLAESLGILLDAPPERLEPGLGLAIELADSVLNYDLRHGGILSGPPVLALVLADPGNPRSLAFTCNALRFCFERLDADDEADTVAALQRDAVALADSEGDLARPLSNIAAKLRQMSNRVHRRFFTLLPQAHQLADEEEVPEAAA